MTELSNITFEQCTKDPVGTVYAEWEERGYRMLILRGPFSLCAYIGVPKEHPLYGVDYEKVPVDCHGGLTFSEEGGSTDKIPSLKSGYWWFGWDYAHSLDKTFMPLDLSDYSIEWLHKWTPREVYLEMGPALKSLEEITDKLKKELREK